MIAELKNAACLSHAARRWLPPSRTGRPVHPSVLSRWADKGIVVGGKRIHLKVFRVGGQRMTTESAIAEFLAALNAGNPASEADHDADATRRVKEASRALEALGC